MFIEEDAGGRLASECLQDVLGVRVNTLMDNSTKKKRDLFAFL